MGESEQLKALGGLLGAAQEEIVDGLLHRPDRARDRLVGRAHAVRNPARQRWVLAVVAIAVAATVVIAVIGAGRRPALTFVAGSGATVGSASPDGWLVAVPGAVLPVRFSDGTELTLEPGGRMRVVALSPEGADLELERGEVRASIVHARDRRWVVSAGPFAITDEGTQFRASWVPEAGRFTLSVDEGSVWVTGPMLSKGRSVVAGERLAVSTADGRLELTYGSGSDAPRRIEAGAVASSLPVATASPVGAPSVASAHVAHARKQASTDDRPPPGDAMKVTTTWRELTSAGRYADAVMAAEAIGFADLCDRLGAEELYELGDTARLAGNAARAREAFGILRARFSSHELARSASFVLGRIALDLDGTPSEGARWFRTYLLEAPGALLAREAAGRLIEALVAAKDLDAARVAAREYVAAYPAGPHVGLASEVLAK